MRPSSAPLRGDGRITVIVGRSEEAGPVTGGPGERRMLARAAWIVCPLPGNDGKDLRPAVLGDGPPVPGQR
jgi:hypothetical protein